MLLRQNVPLILGRSASFEVSAVAGRLQIHAADFDVERVFLGVTSRFAP